MDKYEFIGDYRYRPIPIGQGSFSQVYKGENINKKTEVAIKK